MFKLIEKMLESHKKLSAPRIPCDKTKIQRQINQLTYDLYGLTKEEIKIIEESRT